MSFVYHKQLVDCGNQAQELKRHKSEVQYSVDHIVPECPEKENDKRSSGGKDGSEEQRIEELLMSFHPELSFLYAYCPPDRNAEWLSKLEGLNPYIKTDYWKFFLKIDWKEMDSSWLNVEKKESWAHGIEIWQLGGPLPTSREILERVDGKSQAVCTYPMRKRFTDLDSADGYTHFFGVPRTGLSFYQYLYMIHLVEIGSKAPFKFVIRILGFKEAELYDISNKRCWTVSNADTYKLLKAFITSKDIIFLHENYHAISMTMLHAKSSKHVVFVEKLIYHVSPTYVKKFNPSRLILPCWFQAELETVARWLIGDHSYEESSINRCVSELIKKHGLNMNCLESFKTQWIDTHRAI